MPASTPSAGSLPAESRRPLARLGLARIGLALLLGVLAFALAALGARPPAPGWDEATNVELPAARMALHARRGEVSGALDVLLGCERYPFVAPVCVALTYATGGISPGGARGTVFVLFVLFLVALSGLAREGARELPGRVPALLATGLPVALALTSPLALRHATSVFLEVPFLAVSAAALWAWCRRTSGQRYRREFAAGGLATLAFFTKFNYGALLGLALLADYLCSLRGELRAAGPRASLRHFLCLAALPALVLAWWFVLPWPAGLETAASHRAALLDFLGGNLAMGETPGRVRLFYASFLTARPGWTLLAVLLALASLLAFVGPTSGPVAGLRARVRVAWFALLALGAPVVLHPFHLDRFALPALLPLALLAGVGAAQLSLRWAHLGRRVPAVLALVFVAGSFIGHLQVAAGLGLLDPAQRAEQERAIGALSLFGRSASAGLAAEDAEALAQLLAQAVGNDERVAWIGMSSEVPPASVHLWLLARGGSLERFLADAHRGMDVTPVPGNPDPGWDDAQLARWAAEFDVVLGTDPVDLKDRGGRDWLRTRYQARLTRLGWVGERVGSLSIERGTRDPLEVALWALRQP